nr:MAG TPA: hypothetical protein [Caudoviricetes sp.]
MNEFIYFLIISSFRFPFLIPGTEKVQRIGKVLEKVVL